MIRFALQKTSHPLYHTKPQSLWLHINFRHDITIPVSDITPTVSLPSNLSTDITPNLYDITPTISVTLYKLYITSYPLFTSSHYCTYESKSLIYETTSSMQFKIHTIPVTSQSIVCVLTPNVLRASHPNFVWHHTWQRYSIFCTIEDITSSLYEIKPPFLWHHSHYIWHCINAISVTTSTLLMISHQIYLWDLILYICRHHIHCIQKLIHYICTITATVPVSQTRTFHDITLFVYMILHALYV